MELVPKLFVAGIFVSAPLTAEQLNRQRLNQIWADVAGKYDDYTQLQVSPDGRAAQFVGQASEEGVVIQPPLVQVSDAVRLTTDKSAEKASDIFKTVARHLSVGGFSNLGVKHIYHFTPSSNDARAFLMNEILGKTDEELTDLGPNGIFAGVRYYVPQPDTQQPWLVEIEPLLANPRIVVVNVDAQFSGSISLDLIVSKCAEARQFVETNVKRYIDRASAS